MAAREQIRIQQDFPLSVDELFAILSDHEEFGRVVSTHIERIKDSDGSDPNGLNSVRRIKSFGVPAFEETITAYEPGRLIEYRVTKGSPIKNHLGRMQFSARDKGSHLDYTIDFEPRIGVPFLGKVLKQAIRGPIAKGLARLAEASA